MSIILLQLFGFDFWWNYPFLHISTNLSQLNHGFSKTSKISNNIQQPNHFIIYDVLPWETHSGNIKSLNTPCCSNVNQQNNHQFFLWNFLTIRKFKRQKTAKSPINIFCLLEHTLGTNRASLFTCSCSTVVTRRYKWRKRKRKNDDRNQNRLPDTSSFLSSSTHFSARLFAHKFLFHKMEGNFLLCLANFFLLLFFSFSALGARVGALCSESRY